jgi:hypothetical protein
LTETGTLFNDQAMSAAKQKLAKKSNASTDQIIWFRNALDALIGDIDRGDREFPPTKILAVDASEIYQWVSPNNQQFRPFAFGSFLVPDGTQERDLSERELQALETKILGHLLDGKGQKFLLLDGHADEVMTMRDALANQHQNRQEKIDELIGRDLPNFEGFSQSNIDNLEKFLSSAVGSGTKQGAAEWQKFRDNFLPNWDSATINSLLSGPSSFLQIQNFIKNAPYVFLRSGGQFGQRSISHAFKESFDWIDFNKFINTPDTIGEFQEICEKVADLIGMVPHPGAILEHRALAARRDAQAIGQIHLLNCYFAQDLRDTRVRVELVTRSHTLHKVLAALPSDRLRVTLRHPLLLPDIYNFDAAAISALGGMLDRLVGIIQPLLGRDTGLDDGNFEKEVVRQAGSVARGAVSYMQSHITIQQGIEAKNFGEIYARVQTSKPTGNQVDASKVAGIFDLLSKGLRERRDPFSREAFEEIRQKNKDIIAFMKHRAFSGVEEIEFRIIRYEHRSVIDTNPPDEERNSILDNCLVIRSTNSNFTRLCHLYSSDIFKNLFKEQWESNFFDYNYRKPTIVKIKINDIFDYVESAFQSDERDAFNNKFVDRMDGVLIAALLFADKKYFITAMSLLSTMLHIVSQKIRTVSGNLPTAKENTNVYLAFREMYLLRHYCERAAALDEHFAALPITANSSNAVVRNFARAQRDLDFAALMSEYAEKCFLGTYEWLNIPPAGYMHVRDHRLKLAHMASWMDQLLILARANFTRWPSEDSKTRRELDTLARRQTSWAAAGMVKEILTTAHEVRRLQKRDNIAETPLCRYLGNIEARALQLALTMFVVFLSFRIASDMHLFLKPGQLATPDRTFVFRDWKDWWKRLEALKEFYGFKLRFNKFFNPIDVALTSLAGMKSSQHSEAAAVLSELTQQLRKCAEKEDGADQTFLSALSVALIARIGDIRV